MAEIEAVKYFIRDAQVGEIMVEDKETMELVRLPTCAIFHKLGAGTGVPPSFLGKYIDSTDRGNHGDGLWREACGVDERDEEGNDIGYVGIM